MTKQTLQTAPSTPDTPFPALLNKEQAAQRMGISVRTLDTLVANGEFPRGVRVGRFLYWTEAAILQWHQRLFAAQLGWRP